MELMVLKSITNVLFVNKQQQQRRQRDDPIYYGEEWIATNVSDLIPILTGGMDERIRSITIMGSNGHERILFMICITGNTTKSVETMLGGKLMLYNKHKHRTNIKI